MCNNITSKLSISQRTSKHWWLEPSPQKTYKSKQNRAKSPEDPLTTASPNLPKLSFDWNPCLAKEIVDPGPTSKQVPFSRRKIHDPGVDDSREGVDQKESNGWRGPEGVKGSRKGTTRLGNTKRESGGKLRIQTAAFCRFFSVFTSLFYRRPYCFSGATESDRGARGGRKVRLCLCRNSDLALLFLQFYPRVHESRFSAFTADPYSCSFHPLFFSVRVARRNWQQCVLHRVDRSFTDLGSHGWVPDSPFLFYSSRLWSFLISLMRYSQKSMPSGFIFIVCNILNWTFAIVRVSMLSHGRSCDLLA